MANRSRVSEERRSGELPSVERPPLLLRVRLWQAIAGMSVAIAIASLIVISDLAVSLARRTNYVNRRVAALNAIVRTLRRQTAVEQRKLGSVRERASVGEVFEKILFAADLRTIKLAVPVEKDRAREKSIVQSSWRRASRGKACDERVGRRCDARSERAEADRDLRGLPHLVDAETRRADLGGGFFGRRRRTRDGAGGFAAWTREGNVARDHARK